MLDNNENVEPETAAPVVHNEGTDRAYTDVEYTEALNVVLLHKYAAAIISSERDDCHGADLFSNVGAGLERIGVRGSISIGMQIGWYAAKQAERDGVDFGLADLTFDSSKCPRHPDGEGDDDCHASSPEEDAEVAQRLAADMYRHRQLHAKITAFTERSISEMPEELQQLIKSMGDSVAVKIVTESQLREMGGQRPIDAKGDGTGMYL